MKKTILNLVTVFMILLLCSCGQQGETVDNPTNNTTDTTAETNNSEATQSVSVPEENGEMSVSQDEDEIISVEQAFTAVLLNEMPIFCTQKMRYQNKDVIYDNEYTDFLNNLPNLSNGNNENMIISRFAIVDMDGDTVPEIVLETEDDDGYLNGYCILRYRQGEVWGNAISSRSLENLREDGTHMGDAGAGDIWIEKLYFINDTFARDEIAHMEEGYSYGNYTFHDIKVDKSVWDDIESSFYETKEAEWHEFTEETINEWVTENPLFTNISIEAVAEINGRQSYLDSLYYLIELTFDCSLNEQENPEQYRADAKSYYEGCEEEMNRIYELCMEKLSGQDLEKFQAEQQQWQVEINLKMLDDLNDSYYNSIEALTEKASSLYFECGDRLFRRTLYLINFYYDSEFYD